MSLAVIPLVFVIVLIAELPDKSMFASLVLGTRFPPRWVFAGIATAFLVHVVIAVVAGGLLALLPERPLELIVTGLFLLGAALLWREAPAAGGESSSAPESGRTGGRGGPLIAFTTSFGVIFIGEWGDLTQILTANLAARYDDPFAVGIGATLGLWTAGLLAITAGRTLLRHISMTLLARAGAVVLLAFAGYTLIRSFTG